MSTDLYEITIPPTNEPLLFSEASDWGRDINVADTTLVNSLISSATELFESMTNRVLVIRTFKGFFDNFSTSCFEPFQYIEIRRSPLILVTTVKINGVLLDSSKFLIKNKESFSRILFTETTDILEHDNFSYPIEVIFTAGFEIIPESPITAIKQIVLYWYENRGDVSTDKEQTMPLVSKAIIKQYRIVNSFG